MQHACTIYKSVSECLKLMGPSGEYVRKRPVNMTVATEGFLSHGKAATVQSQIDTCPREGYQLNGPRTRTV